VTEGLLSLVHVTGLDQGRGALQFECDIFAVSG